MPPTPIVVKVRRCDWCHGEFVQTPETHASLLGLNDHRILGGFCSRGCQKAWFDWERSCDAWYEAAQDAAVERYERDHDDDD